MLISIIRTLILYTFIIIAIRLMGKRQISDMQPSELVVTMVISDIASLPMQNTSQPLLSGIIPVTVLVALEITASVLMMKSGLFRRIVCGSPVVVIENGKPMQSEMRRLRLTVDDLCAQLRQQDVFSIEDVQYGIMETNGTLSVLEKPQKTSSVAQATDDKTDGGRLEAVVISDGSLVKKALLLCGKTEADVESILKKENKRACDIFVMTLNADGKYNIIEKEV